MVGETVNESSGSTISAAIGSTAAARESASPAPGTSPVTASRNAATSGSSRGATCSSPSRWMSTAALTSALSAMRGIDACPLRPWTRRVNGDVIFSATPQT